MIPKLCLTLPFPFSSLELAVRGNRTAQLPDKHLSSSLPQCSCDLRCTQSRTLLKQLFNILRENSLFTKCAITPSKLYAKINPKILMKTQRRGKKKKGSTAVFQREYIIYKFKIQALPSYAWSSFKILTIKSLR